MLPATGEEEEEGGRGSWTLFDGDRDRRYEGGGGGTGGQSRWGGSRDDNYGDCDVADNERIDLRGAIH